MGDMITVPYATSARRNPGHLGRQVSLSVGLRGDPAIWEELLVDFQPLDEFIERDSSLELRAFFGRRASKLDADLARQRHPILHAV